MNSDVKVSVDAKCNYFKDYFDIPESAMGEYEALVAKIHALGEQCSDCMEFESRFSSEGLVMEYSQLMMKLTAKPVQMTEEQKKASKEMAIEMAGGKKQIAKDAAADVADSVRVELEQEMHTLNRKIRIEAGVDDDYNRLTNKIGYAQDGAKFLKGLFGKKKK